MRWVIGACLLACSVAGAAEAPKFQMDSAGVRVDLPGDWLATRWTDESLDADLPASKGKLLAWSTPGQLEIDAADLPGWAKVYEKAAESFKGKDFEVLASRVATLGGRPTARVDIAFAEGGRRGVVAGASFAVEGRMFHVAIFGLADNLKLIDQALDMVAERADIKRPAKALPAEATVEVPGISTKLPPGWHAPIGSEMDVVNEAAGRVGGPDLANCWTAVHPNAGSAPDVMMSCHAGISLGVVDELSFADVDAQVLRPKLFGEAPMPPAELVQLSDRVAFLYKPTAAQMTLRVAAVPYGKGVMRTWVIGPAGHEAGADAAITAALKASTYEGDHPAGPTDWVGYYIAYRPTSPMVLVPAILLLAGIAGIIRFVARPRQSPVDDIA